MKSSFQFQFLAKTPPNQADYFRGRFVNLLLKGYRVTEIDEIFSVDSGGGVRIEFLYGA